MAQENNYDEIVKRLPDAQQDAGGIVNPYDAIVPEMVDPDVELRSSFQKATAQNPDKYAEAMRVGKTLNVPAAEVTQDFDRYRRQAEFQSQDFADLEKNHPWLAEWYRNPDNAAMTRDELPVLKQLDRAFRQPAPWRPAPLTDEQILAERDRIFSRIQKERDESGFEWQHAQEEMLQTEAELQSMTFGLYKAKTMAQLDEEDKEYILEKLKEREAFIGKEGEEGFWERIGRRYDENPLAWLPYLSGVADLERAYELYLAAEAAEEGTETEDQRDLLLHAARIDAAAEARGVSVGGMVGATLAEMPAFIGELASSGGIYSAVRQGVVKGGAKVAEGILRRSFQKALTNKWVLRAAASATQTAVARAPHIVKGTVERMSPEGELSHDGENVTYEIKPGTGQSFGVAFQRAFVDQFAEVASERFGKFGFMKKLDEGVNKILFGWWASKAPGRTAQGFMDFLKAANINGIPSEMTEERVGDVIRAIAGDGEFADILASPKQLAAEALAFGAPGFTGAALSRVGRPSQEELAQRAEAHAQQLEEIGKAIGEMKLKTRSPETLQAFIEHEVKETGSEYKYQPTDTFQQYAIEKKLDPALYAEQLTGKKDALKDAITSGQLLEIPTANWAVQIVGTPHEAFFQGELRDTPKSLNRREAQAWKKAKEAAFAESEQQLRAHKEEFEPLVQEMRARGIAPIEGIEGSEYVQNIPLNLRKLKGVPIDAWIGELVEKGKLPQGATENDFYELIRKATTKPEAVMPEKFMELEPLPITKEGTEAQRLKEASKTVEDSIVRGLEPLIKNIPGLQNMKRPDLRRYAKVRSARVRARHEATGRPIEELVQEELHNFVLGGQAPENAQEQPGKTAPTFYSKLHRTIQEKMPARATPAQIRGIVKDIKAEEMEWSGFKEWLDEIEKAPGDAPIGKDSVLGIIESGMVQVQEVVKGAVSKLTWHKANDQSNVWLSNVSDPRTNDLYIEELPPGGRFKFKVSATGGRQGFTDSLESAKEMVNDWVSKGLAVSKTESPTKFSTHTLPGGENYRELLLTLPRPSLEATLKAGGTREDYNAAVEAAGPAFESGHFEEPNVLSHVRFNGRTDKDGKRVLFIEEIQSDWHQKGRKKGYQGDPFPPEVQALVDQVKALGITAPLETVNAKMIREAGGSTELQHEWSIAVNTGKLEPLNERGRVPNAPFKKTWHELVLKRMIRYAAENGFDRIAWTTGEQQADRYDLSKQVDAVMYKKNADGTFNLTADQHGKTIILAIRAQAERLENYVGKELAEKMIEGRGEVVEDVDGEVRGFSGNDLKVGGAGMKGFYDEMLPAAASKLGKKYGAKVGETKIATGRANPDIEAASHVVESGEGEFIAKDPSGRTVDFFNTLEEAEAFVEKGKKEKVETVHALDLTPELKKAVIEEGFPLFQPGEAGRPRGFYDPTPDITALTAAADRSTMFHEPAHRWLFQVGKDYAYVKALDPATLSEKQKRFLSRAERTLAWLGVENFDQLDLRNFEKDSPGYKKAKDAHEQFAQGFEVYLMEGEAPSKELRGVFDSFMNWLLEIYKEIKKLGITLTPEVRDIYDHMLATEEEIAEARSELGLDRFNAQVLGLEGKAADDYNRAVEEDLQAGKAALVKTALADIRRREKKEWKDEAEAFRKEITLSVNDEPVYKARANLQKGTLPDGSPLPEGVQAIKLDRDSIPLKRRPGLRKYYAVEGGVHPSVVAELYGFADGNALLDALETAQDRKEKIEQLVDETMRAIHGDPMTPEEMKEEAEKAVHNDKRVELLMLRIKALSSRSPKRITPIRIIREFAQETVGRMQVRRISPAQALRAEQESARAAVEAAARGDFEGALNASERELLNHEIYRAAVTAKKEIEERIEKFERFGKKDERLAKTRDVDLINAGRAILAEYGLGEKDKQPYQYLEQLGEYDPDLFENIKGIVISATEGATHYKDASVDKFFELADTLDSLWDLSRRTRQMVIDGKIMDRDEILGQLGARLVELKKPGKKGEYQKAATAWDKVKMGLLGGAASLRRVESWVDAMDGGEPSGAFRRFIWTPIREATDRYRQAKREVIEKYLKLVQAVEPTLTREEIPAPELIGKGGRPYMFSGKAELLGALLHTGNRSNLQKLLRGYKWGAYDQETGVLDTFLWDKFIRRMQDEGILTKADYDFVQAIWDLNEELKPQAQKAHKDMYAYYFGDVTADPFTNQFGSYRGGYAPAIADPFQVEDAAVRQEKEAVEKSDNSFMFPTAGRGFTKKRVEAYAAPLQLDLRFVPGHLDKVLRFIHIEPRVKDVGRLIWEKEFQEQLTQHDPTARSEMLVPWLQRAAQQKVDQPSKGKAGQFFDGVWRALRKRTGMQIMVANVANTLQQFTGITIAATKVQPKYLLRGLWTYMRGPTDLSKDIAEKSLFMKNLVSTQVMEMTSTIDDLLLNPNTYQKARQFAERHGYFMQTGTQNIVNLITWNGAYEQAVEQGASELEAVRQADSAVRQTQGSFAAEDLSRFEAGSPFARLFTMFYSYFNMQANLLGTEFTKAMRDLGLRKGAGRMLYVYSMAFMIPAVISEAINRVAGGDFDDDDDGYLDELLQLFFGSQFKSATALIPGGSTLRTGVNAFTKESHYDDNIAVSPAVKTIEATVKAPAEIYGAIAEGKSARRAVQDTLTAVGLFTGFPTGALGRPAGYIADVLQEKVQPSGPYDFTRGVLTGRPGKK